jgi:hypothetical protein
MLQNPTSKTPSTTLSDIQETVRDPASAPFPQPFDFPPEQRMYFVRRVTLPASSRVEIDCGFIAEFWTCYCRLGVATDGALFSTQWQASSAQLWMQADKSIKIPGFSTKLFVETPANSAPLDLFVVATRNCDVWIST